MRRILVGSGLALAIVIAALARFGSQGIGTAWLVGVIWALWVAGWMSRQDRSARDRTAELWDRAQHLYLPGDAADYLAQLEDELDLPDLDKAEVLTELADHLADSIAAITAEGLGRDAAVREAIARLGSPVELARLDAAARRSTRRFLAGVGGGVFQAGIGAFWGVLAGYLVMLAGLFAIAAIGQLLLGSSAGPASWSGDSGTALSAFAMLFAAFVAARFGTRTFVRLSGWSRAEGRRAVAAVGAFIIATLILFVVPLQQGWAALAVEAMIPVAFVVGAMRRTRETGSNLGGRKWAFVAVLAIVVGPALMFSAVSVHSGQAWSSSLPGEAALFDKVAPLWTADGRGLDLAGSFGSGVSSEGVVEQTYNLDNPAALAPFHDVRYEVWRAVAAPGSPDWAYDNVPDPAATAPTAVAPAVVRDGSLVVRFDLGHHRAGRWLLYLTGVASDGVRYRLDWPASIRTEFYGTAWDWLTAGD